MVQVQMESTECVTCGKNLDAADSFVVFPCPECEAEIARCGRCKKLKNDYVCTDCGHRGP